MSRLLGIDLWIKRDDLTGFALGGNKGRKLEYLMAQAIASGADAVVTCGAAQSNFIRHLGAACAVAGLEFYPVVMQLPYEFVAPAAGQGLPATNGNFRLGELVGTNFRLIPNGTWDLLESESDATVQELQDLGKRVYRIPIGGSSPLGAYSFVKAGEEVASQTGPFDQVVFASSSGSTHTGLAWQLRGSATRVIGIACDPEPDIADDFAKLSIGLADLLDGEPLTRNDYDLRFEYVGPGYGIPSADGDEAVVSMARHEGIFLDPIYTGKAFAAVLDLASKGQLPGRTLFWHTGGIPALFARD